MALGVVKEGEGDEGGADHSDSLTIKLGSTMKTVSNSDGPPSGSSLQEKSGVS